jgi:hypothetical protein
MKSKEWLFEAEQNVAKKKIDQQLDQLSDQEIDALLSVIDKSLDEGRFDYNPLADPAPGQSQTPKPQQQKPKQPQPQQQKKPQPQKQQPKPKSEVKAYVDDLGAKEKEALKAVLQKEKEQRAETGEKVSAPPKSSNAVKNLLKIILVLTLSVGVGKYIGTSIGGGDQTTSSPATQTQVQKTTQLSQREKILQSVGTVAETVHSMGRLGYSRGEMVRTYRDQMKYSGENLKLAKIVIDFYWNLGSETDDLYTRDEFKNMVLKTIEPHIPKDIK